MTRYLAPSEDEPTETQRQSPARSVLRHRHFRGTVWSVATMSFALGVVWLIARSMMV